MCECGCVSVCVCAYVVFNNTIDALKLYNNDCEIQDGFSDEMLGDNGAHGANRSNFPVDLLAFIN